MREKFYNKTGFMWVMLFLIPPLGIFLLWKNRKYSERTRVALTGIFGIVFLITLMSTKNDANVSSNDAEAATATVEETEDEVIVEETVEEVVEPVLTPEEQAAKDDEEAQAQAEAEERAAEKAFDDWVDGQFSAWDGSNIYLVDLVKENMNNPKSFEHVETTYWIPTVAETKGIHVHMVYRGTNAFGGVVTNSVNAFCDYEANTITITAQSN